MRAEDLQRFLRAAPFRPFRITMNSGRSFDIRHSEMLHLTRTTAHVYQVGEDGIADDFEMLSLLLIESAKVIETVAAPPNNGQGEA